MWASAQRWRTRCGKYDGFNTKYEPKDPKRAVHAWYRTDQISKNTIPKDGTLGFNFGSGYDVSIWNSGQNIQIKPWTYQKTPYSEGESFGNKLGFNGTATNIHTDSSGKKTVSSDQCELLSLEVYRVVPLTVAVCHQGGK
tara:strand:- start:788 stop:1207 length:420 start_codon:yes stop_codon:yes gene_type:complete